MDSGACMTIQPNGTEASAAPNIPLRGQVNPGDTVQNRAGIPGDQDSAGF